MNILVLRNVVVASAAVWAAIVPPRPLAGQDAPPPPSASSKTVFRCDFESKTDINYDHWPDHWTRRRGPGFPQYLRVDIQPQENSPSGENHFLQLQLDGGAIQVQSPPIDIDPKFDYVLTGRVRTEHLYHNVAFVTITYLDGRQKQLETFASPQFRDEPQWRTFQLGPIGSSASAARARIGLHLTPTAKADLNGVAQFDDIRLAKVPQLRLQTNSPHNIYVTGEPVDVAGRLSHLTEGAIPLEIALIDADERRVDGQTQAVSDEFSWSPKIPCDGFYRVRVSMRTSADESLEREISLAMISPGRQESRGEFGWSLPRGSHSLSDKVLPDLLRKAAVNWVKLPIWKEVEDPDQLMRISNLAERLRTSGVQVVGVLDEPTAEVLKQFRNPDTLPIGELFAEPTIWPGALDAVLSRLSLYVQWWQLGRDDDPSLLGLTGMDRIFRDVQKYIHQYGSNIRVGLVWPWLEELPPERQMPWDFMSLDIDPPFTSQELDRRLASRPTSAGPQRWVTLDPLSRREYDLTSRALDLVSRMLSAKMNAVDVVFVPRPFDPECGLMTADGSPTDLFLPWRTTSLMLTGSSHLGAIKLPRGSKNQLFARGDELVMVVWNDRPTKERLYLGDDVRQTDVWGRTKTPAESFDHGWRLQEIEVGPLPTFLTGVDPLVARWRLRFAISTPRLDVAPGRSQRSSYRIENPSPLGIDGHVQLRMPSSWRVGGERERIKMAGLRSEEMPFQIHLGAAAAIGSYPVRFDFDLTSDRNYKFSVYDTIHVGLGDIELHLAGRLDDAGNLVIDQALQNNTDEPVNFGCVLFVPERGREFKTIRNLGRGQATNTFVLPNGRELLGATLWLRAEELDGDRTLNTELTVEE